MSKTPKSIRERREKPKRQKEKRRVFDWKFWLPFMLGLLALKPLLEPPTISLQPPLNPKNLMSTHFVIHNGSWCDYSDLKVTAMAKNIKTSFVSADDMEVGWDSVPVPRDLSGGEDMTIPYPFRSIGFGGTLLSGDFGLIVSYRLKRFPFIERRTGFHLTVAVQADGNSRFEIQPGGDEMEKEYREYEKQQSLRPFVPSH